MDNTIILGEMTTTSLAFLMNDYDKDITVILTKDKISLWNFNWGIEIGTLSLTDNTDEDLENMLLNQQS